MNKVIARVYGKVKLGKEQAHLRRVDVFTNNPVERNITYVDKDFSYIWFETELIIKPEIGWEIECPVDDYDWGDCIPTVIGIRLTRDQTLRVQVGWPLVNYYEILLKRK